MLKKTIKYVDYDGNEREEDFYFNLSKAELIEMQMSVNGGIDKYLKRIISEKDTVKIMKEFKSIILKAYGEKSDDGKRFVKSEELSEAFSQTEAYSELLFELIADPDKAASFVKGIIPNIPEAQPMLGVVK